MKKLEYFYMLKVYMTEFFYLLSKPPQCTDKFSKAIFDSDVSSPCFDVPKPEISLPMG